MAWWTRKVGDTERLGRETRRFGRNVEADGRPA